MKKVIFEDEHEGLEALLGKRITVFAAPYIYTGDLVGVNAECIRLDKGGIVYETGHLTSGGWQDYQPLPGAWYVMKGAMQSFGILK